MKVNVKIGEIGLQLELSYLAYSGSDKILSTHRLLVVENNGIALTPGQNIYI